MKKWRSNHKTCLKPRHLLTSNHAPIYTPITENKMESVSRAIVSFIFSVRQCTSISKCTSNVSSFAGRSWHSIAPGEHQEWKLHNKEVETDQSQSMFTSPAPRHCWPEVTSLQSHLIKITRQIILRFHSASRKVHSKAVPWSFPAKNYGMGSWSGNKERKLLQSPRNVWKPTGETQLQVEGKMLPVGESGYFGVGRTIIWCLTRLLRSF